MRISSLLVAAALAFASTAHAQVTTTVDDSATAGIAAPAAPQSTGIGSGFGGMIGQPPGGGPVAMIMDSDVLGGLTIDVLGGQCMGQGATYDVGVIYIDSVAGGFVDTSAFSDASTPEAAAVSGLSFGGPPTAPLVFDAGFEADHAIAFTNPVAGGMPSALLFTLVAGGAHMVTPLTAIQPGGPGACSRYQIRGLTVQMLGRTPGQSFAWFATLLNAVGAFRSNEFHGASATPGANIGPAPHVMPPGSRNLFTSVGPIVINEVDADNVGSDTEEFIELLGPPDIRLDGLVIVTYNGGTDLSYSSAVDLDILRTDASGFLVAGNAAVLGVDVVFPNGRLQNGADAVALYIGEGTSFPSGTAVTSMRLVDALVYDTNDSDDVALLAALTPGAPQVNEAGSLGATIESNQRCPDGGLRLDTAVYQQHAPSPGATNTCATCGNGTVEAGEACDDGAATGTASSCCDTGCVLRAVGAVCAASSGVCDADDTCDATGACVVNLAAAGTECRAAAGGCDVAETCDGAGTACPADAVDPAGTVCRSASAGGCDVAETCTGAAATCPADGFAPIGTECRAAAGACDVAERCVGSSAACPVDGFAADGLSCADGTVCDGDELCSAGSCVAGTAPDCDDTDMCTADMCAEPSGCASTPIAGCCNIDADCDDADVCTADTCSGPGGTCSASPITDCCIADGDCDDGNMCTTDVCDLGTNRCARSPVAGCCEVDADCDDTNACTADTCDAATGSCMNDSVAGCCLTAGDCDDANTCTMDVCDTSAMTCANDAIAGCCSADADCDDGDMCTADTCDTGTAACSSDPIPGCAADGGAGGDAGGPGPSDAGVPTDGGVVAMEGGCGCRATRGQVPTPLWALGLALLFVRRRRQK